MTLQLLVENFLSPPILFFVLGIAAALMRSDLEIPQPIAKLLSYYLLIAIGLKGGAELSQSGFSTYIALALGASVLMALAVPVYSFFILKIRLSAADAAAVAATYGSVSAVTFITAAAWLRQLGVDYGGHMIAALALMESPAIIIGVIFFRKYGKPENGGPDATPWSDLLRDSFFNGSVVLLVGSLLIGLVSGERGWVEVAPFADDLFKGVLCLFLLDMGIVAARRMKDVFRGGAFLVTFAVVIPLANAALGILLAALIGMPVGDALLFTTLCASASYIAVPAAMRLAVPEASPSVYLTMSLALTFPFNIVFGIPLYYAAISWLWS